MRLITIMLCATAFTAASSAQADERAEQQGYCMIRLAGAWRAKYYWDEQLPLPVKVIAEIMAACGVTTRPTPSASDPSSPTPPTPTAFSRGLAALNEGNFDAAIAEFTAAIAHNPKDTFSYIRRGTAYEKKGDAASAISDYRKVLTLVDADSGAEYAARIRKLEKTKK
jgi:tetratricopeptide (TPR) repeat protein